MKLFFIITVVIISIAIGAIVIFFVFIRSAYYSPTAPQEGCRIIYVNPGEKKIDLVFFGDGTDEKKAKEYADFLLNASPYNNNKNKFNIFYAGEAQCGSYEDALFCYGKELLRKASVCPHDFIIVLVDNLKNNSVTLRSSFYIQVMSLNVYQPKSAFLHEFGHAFSNLADEYVPSTIPRGSHNCQKECIGFSRYGHKDCFTGCSEADYFRSSDLSVMRTLKTEEYHAVNEILIKEKLDAYE